MSDAHHQTLVLPFVLRDTLGSVSITIEGNDDPAHWGLDLVFPGATDLSYCLGFPVCTAHVAFGTVAGYGANMGWIQVVKSTDGGEAWEMDVWPANAGLESPFAYAGWKPTLFDAPAREDRKTHNDWTAQSFLCVLDDAVMTRRVRMLVAFQWGFVVRDGQIEIKRVQALGSAEWQARLGLLREKYPRWMFHGEGETGE
jgi:hypothetical protein